MAKKNSSPDNGDSNSNSNGFVLTITPLTGVTLVVLLAAILFSWDQYRDTTKYCEVIQGDYEDKAEWITAADHRNRENYLKYEPGTFVYRHIYMSDFEEAFGVKPLHYPIIDEDIVGLLAKHNLRARLENTSEFDPNVVGGILRESDNYAQTVKRVKEQVENGTYVDDGGLYIRYLNEIVGYGMYAGRDFKRRELLEVYAGLITRQLTDLEYAWEFNYLVDVKDDNGNKVRVCIDAKYMGSYSRFANHRDNDQNGDQLYVTFNDIWHVLYTAKRDIKLHEQVFVNYGQGYWENKKKYEF